MLRKAISSLLEIPGVAGRITPMEGLRGYAVFLVFLVHHHTLFGELLPQSSWLFQLSQFGHDIGHSGVDLFFVLSGFLIYGHLLHKSPAYLSYLGKRIRRIYPPFLCIFSLYLMASFWVPSASKLPHPAFRGFVYLVENLLFMPGIFPIEPLITVTWSLSYEFFFYLTIPLLIGVLGLRSWSRPLRISFFLGLLLVHCAGCYFGVLPHIRLSLFIAGILLYEVIDAEWTKGRLSSSGEFLVISVYIAALMALSLFEFSAARVAFHPHFPNRSYVYWAAFLCVSLFGLILFTINFNGVLQSIFTATPLRWLGNMSYTYFLFHGIVLNGVAYFLRGAISPELSPAAFLALLLMNLAMTVGGSMVLFLLVEKPFSLGVRQPRVSNVLTAQVAASDRPEERSALSAKRG